MRHDTVDQTVADGYLNEVPKFLNVRGSKWNYIAGTVSEDKSIRHIENQLYLRYMPSSGK